MIRIQLQTDPITKSSVGGGRERGGNFALGEGGGACSRGKGGEEEISGLRVLFLGMHHWLPIQLTISQLLVMASALHLLILMLRLYSLQSTSVPSHCEDITPGANHNGKCYII